jgi:hypothetical protein
MAGLIYGLPTISQAGIITLGDGSQYEIRLDGHQGNTWTYFVKEVSGKSLSHWNVGIKACRDNGAVVSTSPTGDVEDGSTSFEGMKWDVAESFTQGSFSITLDADYPETTIKAQAKAGRLGNERTGDVIGPDCMAEPSVPDDVVQPNFVAEEPKVCDFYYGVHDEGLNDSHFFTVDPNNGFELAALPLYHKDLRTGEYIYSEVLDDYDIEAIDVDREDEIYAASGDNSVQPGHLYWVDMLFEELVEVCQTDYAEVDGISFNPADNSLWGWAQDVGLFKMTDLESCTSQVVIPTEGEFEDLTWNNAGTKLYVALNVHGNYEHIRPYLQADATYIPDTGNDAGVPHMLLGFDSTTGSVTEVCRAVVAGKEIEALEILPDGQLMLGYHNSNGEAFLAVVNPETCEITKEGSPKYNITAQKPFGDIEALGACISDGNVPPQGCPLDTDTGWMYVTDSVTDATGLAALEIYGMAIRQQGNTVTVAINANMDQNGITKFPGIPSSVRNRITDGHVGFSDLVFDFGGNQYAVHFSANDSGVTELGLYENVTLKDVAKENAGYDTLNSYKNSASNPSLGDISFSGNYFDWNGRWNVPMSIVSGDKIGDITSLTAADLAGMGLDFATGLGTNRLGTNTFGFSFTKAAGMEGDFTAYVFTECRNDGVGMVRKLPDCE